MSEMEMRKDLTEDLRQEFRALNLQSRDRDYRGKMSAIIIFLRLTKIDHIPAIRTYNSWPKPKRALYNLWNEDPDEMESREHNRIQRVEQALAARITPAAYSDMVDQLDVWDTEQLKAFTAKVDKWSSELGTRTPVVPFPLFKQASDYLYYVAYPAHHTPWWDNKPEGRWIEKNGPLDPLDSWTRFDPPITVPPHLRSAIDTEYSSSLEYAIPLGHLRYHEDGTITKTTRLHETAFVVFLHPADKSFWIVFNTFPFFEQNDVCGEPEVLESVTQDSSPLGTPIWQDYENPVAVWRMPFSDVRRCALLARPDQVNATALDAALANVPKPLVVVDGRDPAWTSMDPLTHPRPHPSVASRSELQKYRDMLSTLHPQANASSAKAEPSG